MYNYLYKRNINLFGSNYPQFIYDDIKNSEYNKGIQKKSRKIRNREIQFFMI